MIRLVVGLGNPGIKYENNRHNLGRMVLDKLSFSDTLMWQNKFKGFYAVKRLKGENIYFLLPLQDKEYIHL